MTSSSTQESTRVAGRIAGLFATQQRHDLVGAHARDVVPGGGVAQAAGQPPPPGLGPLGADDPERTADLDNLDLVPSVQPVLGPQMRRDGHLAFAVQLTHPIGALRNTSTSLPYGRLRAVSATSACWAEQYPRHG